MSSLDALPARRRKAACAPVNPNRAWMDEEDKIKDRPLILDPPAERSGGSWVDR